MSLLLPLQKKNIYLPLKGVFGLIFMQLFENVNHYINAVASYVGLRVVVNKNPIALLQD